MIAFVIAAPANAVAAKFHSATGSVTSMGALSVSFDERGVGNGNIDYTLTANSAETWACLNNGGKHPQAANKEDQNSAVLATGSFKSKNGRVRGTLTTDDPTNDGFSCPKGQRLVLAKVSYTNILLTDTTNGTSTMVGTASRTFFDV